MYVRIGQVQALGPVGHEAPHEAFDVERGPADAKHQDQHNCGGREGSLGAAPVWSAHSPLPSYSTGYPCPLSIRKFAFPFREAALTTVTEWAVGMCPAPGHRPLGQAWTLESGPA